MIKKNLIPIIFLLFSPLFLRAQSYVDLHFNFKEGSEFQIHQKANKETYLTVGEVEQRTSNQKETKLMLTVKKVNPDGSATLSANYQRIILSSSQDGNKIYVDTKSEESDVFNKLFKALIDQKFNVTISEYGKIESVSGMDPIFDKMIDALSGVKKNEKEELKAFLITSMGPEQVKLNLSFVIPQYALFKVHKGDAWTNHTKAKSLYGGTIDNYWELQYGNDFMAKLENKAKYYSEPSTIIDLGGGQEGRAQLEGDITSNYVINASSSWPTRSIVHSELKGDFIFMGDKKKRKKKGNLKVPVRIIQNISYEIKHF